MNENEIIDPEINDLGGTEPSGEIEEITEFNPEFTGGEHLYDPNEGVEVVSNEGVSNEDVEAPPPPVGEITPAQMISVKLSDDALIGGNLIKAGKLIDVFDESIVKEGYSLAKREIIREKIYEKSGDIPSLVGSISDSSSYAIDNVVMDVLALSNSADSSYKKERIALFENLHGTGSWIIAKDKAQEWFDKRVNKEIVLPIDIKGIYAVFDDVAVRGAGVAEILKAQ